MARDKSAVFDPDFDEQGDFSVEVAKLRATQDDEILHELLNSQGGRAFVARVLDASYFEYSSFAGEDVHTTNFREGRRSIGIELMGEVRRVLPGSEELMKKEARLREDQYRSTAEAILARE